MGIFSRVADIISSNINAMLDKAEDPTKMVKLMIREMEDTLVELRASCAGAMAQKKKVQRAVDEAEARAEGWANKAGLAVKKNRDDLAREALMEKRRYLERAASLQTELGQNDALVSQYQNDIAQLEDKLSKAREKQRTLTQRQLHARGRVKAEQGIRGLEGSGAVQKFEEFENRIELMEAEADLVNYGRKASLEEQFSELETDDDIEAQLQALKEGSDSTAE